jgi:peptidyl-prolyl cis-trans isomerase D
VLQSLRSSAKYIWWVVFFLFIITFLLLDTSGVLTLGAVTPNTPVATVNGQDILYTTYVARSQELQQQASQQSGRALNLDEIRQLDEQAFEELVSEVLLHQEYERRGVTANDDEIRQAARYIPHPQLMQLPDLQTDGRFDPVKYERFMATIAPQQGLLPMLEAYYRSEIPRQKLFEQIAADVYLTDARMWQLWQDVNDSAQVSFVALTPDGVPDSAVTVTDAEIRRYYDQHKDELGQTGRASVSVLRIPKLITAADSASARSRAARLRGEIAGGAKFEEVAARESADSGSALQGGALGMSLRDRFDSTFAQAAWSLRVGEMSQPVLTRFGYHIIRADKRSGDSLDLRHILVPIEQNDSTAGATDRLADSLSTLAAQQLDPAMFDTAAARLGLQPIRTVVFERQPLMAMGEYVPSVSAWAFSGVRPGEISDLFDSETGYYLARVDSLQVGGTPEFAQAAARIRDRLMREKKVQSLIPEARALSNAASESSLEQAARARGLTVTKTEAFNRIGFVPGLGQGNEAIGAAFGLPAGSVSGPVTTADAVYVIRVDRRVNADRAKWEAQKAAQRQLLAQSMRQDRVRQFLQDLRASAEIEDNRREIEAAQRRAAAV